ncbi:hypothetical protein BCR39DRAFT_556364 [Naematelia encephala]|uniref:Alpha/Beta hydrolase protein n=1 Tax=Naematelia encephala TaxID=71784 RepID=A0A1Y2BJA7_9TREE|nr:hypothetical protein BCR39DRAFT_556364 [Naematelia encephala]
MKREGKHILIVVFYLDGTDPGVLIAADVAEGETEIQLYMTSVLATCPETKFVLFSYSFGTFAQVLALNNPTIPGFAISAIIYYGSAFWHPGKPENRGTATKGTSLAGNYSIATPAIYEPITADYCLYGDYLCTGTNVGDAHHKYLDSKWQTDAINFAVGRLKKDGIVESIVDTLTGE